MQHPLRYLAAQPDFEIVGVVTPDRPRGRGQQVSISPVKAIAVEAGIPIYQPEKIKSPESLEHFKRVVPDVVVIIAYGQIISARLIEIPRLGWINLHGSLLPKYRGAAPINWAIVNGESSTGLTTMQIDPGLDTGPMLLKYETPVGTDETAPELTTRLADAGGPLMAETLRKFARSEIVAVPQEKSAATFAPLLKKYASRWRLATHPRIATVAGSVHDISRQELPNLGQAVAAGGSAAADRTVGRRHNIHEIRNSRRQRKRERAPS